MKFLNNFMAGALAIAAVTAVTTAVLGADISGAGATFPFPIYSKWAAAYKAQTGIGLNYQSIGSGGGIAQIEAKTVTSDPHRIEHAGSRWPSAGKYLPRQDHQVE